MGEITIGGEFGYAESTNRKGALHAYEGIKNVLKHYGILEGTIVKVDPGRPTPPRFVQAGQFGGLHSLSTQRCLGAHGGHWSRRQGRRSAGTPA